MKEFTITKNEAGQRFDKYLKKLLGNAGTGFLYKMLRKKNIVLNGKKADGKEKLSEGDIVKVFLSDETFHAFSGANALDEEFAFFSALDVPGLPVVYEDDDIMILNKPSGMLSQKADQSGLSANEYIIASLIQRGELDAAAFRTFKPSVCNRLDRNTSGLLIAGKSLKGLQEMSEALRHKKIRKYYRCIVLGEIKEKSYLKGYLVKDGQTNKVTVYQTKPGGECRPIEMEYRPIAGYHSYTELEVELITGRSHQIRACLAFIGHPVACDMKYGNQKANELFYQKLNVKSQLLHAYRIVFADGREVTAEVESDYKKALRYIRECDNG